ncbi:MAG: hypothetical protein ACI9ON_001996 [Limisphaerales bacterium]|jgi:hypothetical protein
MRTTATNVTELLHDGLLTVCVEDFPFAYVGAYKAHVSVGFFYGAAFGLFGGIFLLGSMDIPKYRHM